MALLSIIIPIYNAGKYLSVNLDSLLCQKEADDCEILLINDGSTDNSLDIIRRYINHRNIKLIDKENEGVSATRNRGLADASGEYILFVDADDVLHPDALKLITRTLKEKAPDMLTWQFTAFYRKPKFANADAQIEVMDLPFGSRLAFNYFMESGFAVSLCNKAIRRSLIGDIIRFDPSMSYGEDMFFSWKCILLAQNILYIKFPLYYYRQTGNSAVSRYHADLYAKYAKAFGDIEQFAKNHNIYDSNLRADLDYHLACRIPSLTKMECRAPYSKEMQSERLRVVLGNPHIQRALKSDNRLKGKIYDQARSGDIEQMLKDARRADLKRIILYPLKRLLK